MTASQLAAILLGRSYHYSCHARMCVLVLRDRNCPASLAGWIISYFAGASGIDTGGECPPCSTSLYQGFSSLTGVLALSVWMNSWSFAMPCAPRWSFHTSRTSERIQHYHGMHSLLLGHLRCPVHHRFG